MQVVIDFHGEHKLRTFSRENKRERGMNAIERKYACQADFCLVSIKVCTI